MAKLNQKIKIALDESRMLILGTQILLGFQYRAIFERAFEKLPPTSQYLKLAALGILLIAMLVILAFIIFFPNAILFFPRLIMPKFV